MKNRQVTIVVGSARGIGLGIALAFAKRGDRLVLADPLFADARIRAGVRRKVGRQAVIAAVDITDRPAVERLAADTVRRFGRIDCLVNSAGICRPAPLATITQKDWDAVIAVNLTGAFIVSQAVAAFMVRRKRGRIIHIASTASNTAAPDLAPYVASKHGLVGLVKGMACDLAKDRITVNAVCPGNCRTDILSRVIEDRANAQGRTADELWRDIVRKTPLGRLGLPDDIAAAVLFLSSDAAEFVTAQALVVDGGRSLNLV